jgi:small subunit ribosomal protein S9
VSDTTPPEGPRDEEPEVTPEQIPAETADEPVADVGEPETTPEPAASEPEPVAAAEPEPAAAEPEPAATEPESVAAEEPEPAVAEPVAAEEPEPAAAESDTPAAAPAAGATDDEELTPRVRPEIPGADLIPDIVSDGEEYLDAEARAAAEAEAEAAAAAGDDDPDAHSQPIANAAIDLASGARYVATGKRKSAVARVILKPGTGTYLINGKLLDDYFPRATLQRVIRQPLETVGYEARMDVIARMHGGGVAAQAGALRHGISKALLEADPNLRGELKRRGFLTRDPRVKERKKAGLKKARKRPQFSKR